MVAPSRAARCALADQGVIAPPVRSSSMKRPERIRLLEYWNAGTHPSHGTLRLADGFRPRRAGSRRRFAARGARSRQAAQRSTSALSTGWGWAAARPTVGCAGPTEHRVGGEAAISLHPGLERAVEGHHDMRITCPGHPQAVSGCAAVLRSARDLCQESRSNMKTIVPGRRWDDPRSGRAGKKRRRSPAGMRPRRPSADPQVDLGVAEPLGQGPAAMSSTPHLPSPGISGRGQDHRSADGGDDFMASR